LLELFYIENIYLEVVGESMHSFNYRLIDGKTPANEIEPVLDKIFLDDYLLKNELSLTSGE
jgi:hypothetical protein